MSDMDEGDTPYADKSCRKCGLVESPRMHWEAESTGKCPGCDLSWPACLEERSPYDGKDRPERRAGATACRNLPGDRYLAIYFNRGWTVSSRNSTYWKEGWTEGQAVAFAERCEALQAQPGSLGKAEEEAARRAPALKLVRDNPYKAATLLQDAMDNDETEAPYSEKVYLARKLVARADWAWEPGMFAIDEEGQTYRVVCVPVDLLVVESRNILFSIDPSESLWVWNWTEHGIPQEDDSPPLLPDIDDPATGGILLGRVKFGQDDSLYRIGRGWRFRRAGGGLLAGMSLGEVAAKAILLEAP